MWSCHSVTVSVSHVRGGPRSSPLSSWELYHEVSTPFTASRASIAEIGGLRGHLGSRLSVTDIIVVLQSRSLTVIMNNHLSPSFIMDLLTQQ